VRTVGVSTDGHGRAALALCLRLGGRPRGRRRPDPGRLATVVPRGHCAAVSAPPAGNPGSGLDTTSGAGRAADSGDAYPAGSATLCRFRWARPGTGDRQLATGTC
jgi:hypothetical protein